MGKQYLFFAIRQPSCPKVNFINFLLFRTSYDGREALGISNVIRKLQLFFGHDIAALPLNDRLAYLEYVTSITCYFIDCAKLEEGQLYEDSYYMEACDNMLEAWLGILNEFPLNNEHIKKSSAQIFKVYLNCHLAPPYGSRIRNESNDDIEDNEDNDRIKFKEQLQVIGSFGRVVPSYSIPLMFG